MNAKPIREYNKRALIDIKSSLEFSADEREPVSKEITFSSFIELGYAITNIFTAIEVIAFNGNKMDMATCAGLALLGKKLVPITELEFLDELLIKDEQAKTAMSKIADL